MNKASASPDTSFKQQCKDNQYLDKSKCHSGISIACKDNNKDFDILVNTLLFNRHLQTFPILFTHYLNLNVEGELFL